MATTPIPELWLQMLGLTKESFPLPTFGPTLRQLVDEGVHTRGFQMLRCKIARLAPLHHTIITVYSAA